MLLYRFCYYHVGTSCICFFCPSNELCFMLFAVLLLQYPGSAHAYLGHVFVQLQSSSRSCQTELPSSLLSQKQAAAEADAVSWNSSKARQVAPPSSRSAAARVHDAVLIPTYWAAVLLQQEQGARSLLDAGHL
jgi:hypothetical protein